MVYVRSKGAMRHMNGIRGGMRGMKHTKNMKGSMRGMRSGARAMRGGTHRNTHLIRGKRGMRWYARYKGYRHYDTYSGWHVGFERYNV